MSTPTWQAAEPLLARLDRLIAECDALEAQFVQEAETQINSIQNLLTMQQGMRGPHGR